MSINVYSHPHYNYTTTFNVPYASTLINCSNPTDPSTCISKTINLDIYLPTGDDGPYPCIMSIHGGGYTSGDKSKVDPPNPYWAERGFVTFAIDYRLLSDAGVYPDNIDWEAEECEPNGSWSPKYSAVYPAVRDAKAAVRWINKHGIDYGGDCEKSLTIQGGSAGATTAIELGLTGGDGIYRGNFTDEVDGDWTLNTTNLDINAKATGVIDFWGALFAEDAAGGNRWSETSVPTIAFHGTNDTTVAPESGEVLCSKLTDVGVKCENVKLEGYAHGCWDAKLLSGESIFDYAFTWMADVSGWNVIDEELN